ncbi:MAG: caspase family protein [Candidatus Scalindua sp.]
MIRFKRNVKIMIKKLVFLFAFILIATILHAEEKRGVEVIPRSPTGHQVRGNQWLFVIGINTYIDWPHLSTAVNDAKTVRNVLLEKYHFDNRHLIELYDEEATRSNILDKLRFLARRVGPDDSVVIFYAGHGHLDSITKSGSWIPVESGIENTSAWISNHDVKEYLKVDVIKAKHILLISDSCFSGDFFRGKRGRLPEVTDEVIKRAYKLSSRQAITSGGLEPVVDTGFSGNSVFTHFLVKTFEENEKPFLIPSDLFPDIKAGVAENAEQFPRFGTLKDTGGQQGGELVFFLKKYGSDFDKNIKDRQAELDRLRKLEREAKDAREKEQAEITLKEEELAKLDTKIREMKGRLGTTAAGTDGNLDTMFAMVKDKERQAKRLEELRRKRESEERKRLADIERLKIEQAKKRNEEINEDIRKYEEIVSSKYGRDMKKAAWNNLVSRYPEAGNLRMGDIAGLRRLYIEYEMTDSFTGMKFILVEGGCFEMGDTFGDGEDDEKPVHEVCVDVFYIGKYEGTQGQWEEVMGDNPSKFKNGRN